MKRHPTPLQVISHQSAGGRSEKTGIKQKWTRETQSSTYAPMFSTPSYHHCRPLFANCHSIPALLGTISFITLSMRDTTNKFLNHFISRTFTFLLLASMLLLCALTLLRTFPLHFLYTGITTLRLRGWRYYDIYVSAKARAIYGWECTIVLTNMIGLLTSYHVEHLNANIKCI